MGVLYWPEAAWTDAKAFLRSATREQRWLLWLALGLIASGLAHVGVWAVLGGSLEGPVSWRKPIVFGLSAGVTSLSLAWVLGHLPRSKWRTRLAALYTVTMAPEVALITLQQWRGVGSHFNDATPFDSVVFSLMGVLILVACIPMVAFSVSIFRARGLPADARAALIPALALLMGALVLGVALSVWGSVMSELRPGTDFRTVGSAGVAKFPHGIALHGLQVLPLLAWMLRRALRDVQERARLLRRGAAGYVLLFVVAFAHTALGRAPADFNVATASAALAGVVLLAWPFAVALRSAKPRGAFDTASAEGM